MPRVRFSLKDCKSSMWLFDYSLLVIAFLEKGSINKAKTLIMFGSWVDGSMTFPYLPCGAALMHRNGKMHIYLLYTPLVTYQPSVMDVRNNFTST